MHDFITSTLHKPLDFILLFQSHEDEQMMTEAYFICELFQEQKLLASAFMMELWPLPPEHERADFRIMLLFLIPVSSEVRSDRCRVSLLLIIKA